MKKAFGHPVNNHPNGVITTHGGIQTYHKIHSDSFPLPSKIDII